MKPQKKDCEVMKVGKLAAGFPKHPGATRGKDGLLGKEGGGLMQAAGQVSRPF